MHKIILLPLLFLFVTKGFTQDLNKVIYDEEAEQKILIGYSDTEGLLQEPFASWFVPENESYETDLSAFKEFNSEKLNDIHIIAVIATWCSDTRRQLPRFLKVLEDLDYNMHRLAMIAVDKTKENAGEFDISELDIEYVPTFIFYEGKDELGRIIEKPETSIETDIINILSQ